MKNNLILGIHECSYIDSFGNDCAELFPFLKECGFSYVEFSVLGNYDISRAAYLRKKLSESGLYATCCSCLPEGANFVNGSDTGYKAGIAYLKKCVDFCFAIGSELMSGILYSSWGCGNLDIPKQRKLELAALALREAADYAAGKGVTLCLEVLNRYESDYVNTLEEGRSFLKLIDRDNVKLLADVFHMNIEETDMVAAFRQNADIVGNIHISENNRDFPGYGAFNWEKILGAVCASGYSGNICYECSTKQGTETGNAFNIWRSFSTDDDLKKRLKRSAAFISNLL